MGFIVSCCVRGERLIERRSLVEPRNFVLFAMDFSRIPDCTMLKIFRQLPFRDAVRLGRVNERFYDISTLIVSKIKTINLGYTQFKNLGDRSLESLLIKCRPNLKKMVFSNWGHGIDVFERFSFPNLVEIDLAYNMVFAYQFWNLIKQNKKLAIVKSRCYRADEVPSRVIFPSDYVCEKLEAVKVSVADEDFFVSMIGHCPNLKKLTIGEMNFSRGSKRDTILNKFFTHFRHLQSIHVNKCESEYVEALLTKLESFWHMHLRDLRLGFGSMHSDVVQQPILLDRIVSVFPDLEGLRADDCSAITPQWISTLASFRNLRRLEFSGKSIGSLEESLKKFIGNAKIERLGIVGVSPTTFRDLVRHCPNLKLLRTSSCPSAAAVKTFGGFATTSIEIRVRSESSWSSSDSISNDVEAALKKMKDAGIRKITITNEKSEKKSRYIREKPPSQSRFRTYC